MEGGSKYRGLIVEWLGMESAGTEIWVTIL
jgi:hypothetical protein